LFLKSENLTGSLERKIKDFFARIIKNQNKNVEEEKYQKKAQSSNNKIFSSFLLAHYSPFLLLWSFLVLVAQPDI
jgi:hypothetical protein